MMIWKKEHGSMKRIPNMITCLRMAAALGFLFVKPLSGAFFCLYGTVGLSDILDGWLARRLKTEDRRGAMLDSIADLVFSAALIVVLAHVLPWEKWAVCWICGIAAVRLTSAAVGFVRFRQMVFLHTWSNKATGLLLFALPLLYLWLGFCVAFALACGAASLSALEELALMIRMKNPDRNTRGILWRM